MKKLLFILSMLLISAGAFAQGSKSGDIVTFRFAPGDNMFYIPWSGNNDELTRLYGIVDRYRTDIVSGAMPVYVDGYSASMQAKKSNLDLAFIRANRVKSELIVHKGLKEEHFITKNYTTAYVDEGGVTHKDMVVVTLRMPSKADPPRPEPKPEPKPEPAVEPKPEPQPEPVVETKPEPVPEPAPRNRAKMGLDIRTNLLYDALLTPTLGLEWRINNVGIKLDGSYAHWGSEHGRVQKLWLLSPEVRVYMGGNKRLYVGVGANIGEFNLYKGVARIISKDTGYQGDVYGGGVTVGYRLPFNNCLAMDFNLGLGCTHFSYDSFTVVEEVRVYKDRDKSKNLWGPTQAGVSLIWSIGNK